MVCAAPSYRAGVDSLKWLEFDQVFGLRFNEAITEAQKGVDLPEEVQQMVTARDEARKNKDWAESDRLRDELQAKGFEVLDSAEGTTLRKK